MAIKVLIVDDAMFMRNMIAEIFNGKNYSGEEYEVVAEADLRREPDGVQGSVDRAPLVGQRTHEGGKGPAEEGEQPPDESGLRVVEPHARRDHGRHREHRGPSHRRPDDP